MLPLSFLGLLAQLIRAPSVVGAEHSFFRQLQRELEERGAHVSWYEGVLVAHGKRPNSVMFSAHIDRHGLVCTGPNEFQFACFVTGARSDLLGNSVSEQLMAMVESRYINRAVYAYDTPSGSYRGKGYIRETRVCQYRNNLIFDVTGLEHVEAGTPVAFEDKLRIEDDKFLVGQLDNVLSAAALVYLFELGFEGTAFFTAQEEAGKSWRYLLEWFRRFGSSTNQLIVLDTSPFPDRETSQLQTLVLRNRDANSCFNKALTERVHGLCKSLGYSVQFKDEYIERLNADLPLGKVPQTLGSTEMGRIIAASRGLVDGTTLQVPTSAYHTVDETAPVESVLAYLNVLLILADLPARF